MKSIEKVWIVIRTEEHQHCQLVRWGKYGVSFYGLRNQEEVIYSSPTMHEPILGNLLFPCMTRSQINVPTPKQIVWKSFTALTYPNTPDLYQTLLYTASAGSVLSFMTDNGWWFICLVHFSNLQTKYNNMDLCFRLTPVFKISKYIKNTLEKILSFNFVFAAIFYLWGRKG